MKRQTLLAHLHKHGCTLRREGKAHSIYENPANGRTSAVPRHTEVNDVTARKICRDLGIAEPGSEFLFPRIKVHVIVSGHKPGKATLIDTDATYETLMARLTAVVDRLETGTLPLAEALALYEEGVALGAACERLLERAELRVRSLSVSEDGVGVEDWNEAQPLGDG